MSFRTEGQYEVFIDQPEAPAWDEASKGFSWAGVCGAASGTFIVWWFVVGNLANNLYGTGVATEPPSAVILGTIVSWVILFLVGTFLAYLRYGRKRIVELTRSRLNAKQQEAEQLSQKAVVALASSVQLASDLPAILDAARNCLQKAEREFAERAFGPFWDAVEKAARHLEVFRGGLATVRRDADSFYKALDGRRHSFPSFGSRASALPDPSPVVQELQRLVRRGQTDFQFANIWEHRRTREVLIAGFRTLEDGISNLGYAISSSISDLQSSLSSRLAEIVERQIALHDTVHEQGVEQGRMLDNIQRRRKP